MKMIDVKIYSRNTSTHLHSLSASSVQSDSFLTEQISTIDKVEVP